MFQATSTHVTGRWASNMIHLSGVWLHLPTYADEASAGLRGAKGQPKKSAIFPWLKSADKKIETFFFF